MPMRLRRQGASVRWVAVHDHGAPAPDAAPPVEALALPVALPDPSDMTVAQGLVWMNEHPDLVEAFKALEADGKARKSLLLA